MEDCSWRSDVLAMKLKSKAFEGWSALVALMCLVAASVGCSTAWAADSISWKATVVSRTQQTHSEAVLRTVRYNEDFDWWTHRSSMKPVAKDSVEGTGWEIRRSGGILMARREGEGEFRIYDRKQLSVFRFRCLGSSASSCGSLRRLAYLRDSNAWISHRPVFAEDRSGDYFAGEASTLLDRNVAAIAWTADGRHIVYCRDATLRAATRGNVGGGNAGGGNAGGGDFVRGAGAEFTPSKKTDYELVAYSLADDDYTVLMKFATSKARPVMGRDSTNGFYLVTNGNLIRRIAVPVDVTRFRFDQLNQIPVLYEAIGETVDSIFQDADGRVRVLETEADGAEFETILSLEFDENPSDISDD